VGYGIGLLNAWAVLWTATLVVFNDFRTTARRIEQIPETQASGSAGLSIANGHASEALAATASHADGIAHADAQLGTNQHGLRLRQAHHSRADSMRTVETPHSGVETMFIYQALPENFWHRLDWVSDLVCSFRGARWRHRISELAPPPPHIQTPLADPDLPPPTPFSHITRVELLRRNLPQFLLLVLALDVLKTIAMQDPYFWSLQPSTASPFPWPRLSRLLLSAVSCYASLQSIFILSPLVFAVILGPERIGQHAWPWLYAPFFGSPRQISRKGVAGAWGQWWQQNFRFGFEQAGEFAGNSLGWEKQSQEGGFLRMWIAFACSGALHACASHAALGNTKPLLGSFAWFMLQPVGIIGQRGLSAWMKKVGLRERLPGWLREVGNSIFVFVWFYVTGPLVADDFAATGIWLVEPLPVSPLRGLMGDGWWRGFGPFVSWHSDEKWWRSGLAF